MKTGFCLEVVLKVSICNFKHFLSPLAPLKKGGTRIKVILKKGDLGGSKSSWYITKDFSNILLDDYSNIQHTESQIGSNLNLKALPLKGFTANRWLINEF